MPATAIDTAPDWVEQPACADAPDLLVESDGRLKQLRSDGSEVHDFGVVGPVDCPLAYDATRRTAYRYVCGAGLHEKDYSLLRAYSLERGQSTTVCELPHNQWALWLLEWIDADESRGGQLFGLLASDLPVEGQVCIQHRLFALDPERPPPRVRPLCRDAYKPLAFSRKRRELVFSGAEGTYLVGLHGQRLASLGTDQLPAAHGADFEPGGAACVALGGEGIHLWDLHSGSCRCLSRLGRHPVWSQDGQCLWYAGSSGDLRCYDLSKGCEQSLLALRQNRFPDFWKSRPAQQSRCGRYLAVMLSAQRLKGVTRKTGGIEKSEKVYEAQNSFCILDLEKRSFWRIGGGYFCAFRWV